VPPRAPPAAVASRDHRPPIAAAAKRGVHAKATMQIRGDPNRLAKTSDRSMNAAPFGNAVDGILESLPPVGKTTA